MDAIYERVREQDEVPYIFADYFPDFPPHFHINVEIFVVKEGEYDIFCNGKTYSMQKNSIAFFDSYDVHGYTTKQGENAKNLLFILPFPYLEKFLAARKKQKLSSPIIQDEQLVDEVYAIAQKYLLSQKSQPVVASAFDLLLAVIEEKLPYALEADGEDTKLVKRILQYLENNYRKDTRLSTVAKALGYTPEHLSRTFHKCLRKSIPAYVNALRLSYIEKHLHSGKSLQELVFDAGFSSLQTYYRNKKLSQG